MRNILHWITLACLTTLLAACGGGGGAASNAVASTDTFQVKTAWVNYFTYSGARPFNVSGTSSGVPYTGSGTVSANGAWPATFEFISGFFATTVVNGTLNVNGGNYTLYASSSIYVDSNYNPIGATASGEYDVVQGVANIPATAKVGDSGTWYTSDRYSDPTKAIYQGTQIVSYALAADTATTALLRVTIVNKNTVGATISSETLTFRMTPAGVLTLLTDNTSSSTTTVNITFP